MVYKWKINDTRIDPNVAGQEFEKIENENGFISPGLIVQAARSSNSPLQSCFEWDDKIAGEKYRENQAGDMLRKLVIINPTEKPDKEDQIIRAYVNVISPDKNRQYVSIIKALSNDGLRDQVLLQAIAELKAIQAKYNDLIELAEVFKAIEAVKA